MILGAISCPKEQKRRIFDNIREIKLKYGLDSRFEIKWTKVSDSKKRTAFVYNGFAGNGAREGQDRSGGAEKAGQ